MPTNPEANRFVNALHAQGEARQEYMREQHNAWRNRAYHALASQGDALSAQKSNAQVSIQNATLLTPAIKRDLDQQLVAIERQLPPGVAANRFQPVQVITELYRTRAWIAELTGQATGTNSISMQDPSTTLALQATLSYLTVIERSCGIPPYPESLPQYASGFIQHPYQREFNQGLGNMARTGVAVLLGVGAIGMSTLTYFSGGDNYMVAGLYGLGAAAAAMGPQLFETRAGRQIRELQNFSNRPVGVTNFFGQIAFLEQGPFEMLRRQYGISGDQWADIIAAMQTSGRLGDRYLSANTPAERQTRRQALIDSAGGTSGGPHDAPPGFVALVTNRSDFGQFFTMIRNVRDREAREVVVEYVRRGITAERAAAAGVRIMRPS